MAQPDPDSHATARKAQKLGIVLVVTMGLWLGVQNLGGRFGWDYRLALVFDLVALAAFIWALVGTYRIWRQRQGN